MTMYFGPEAGRKPYETQIAAPVGVPCGLCLEAIEVGDVGIMQMFVDVASSDVRPVHHECTMRSVIGSVAHIEGRCSCQVPGADEGDDPALSRRDAARAALRAFEATQGRVIWSKGGLDS